MPKAAQKNSTSRRRMLAGAVGAGLAVAAPAIAAPPADTAITAAAAARDAETAFEAAFEADAWGPDLDRLSDAIDGAMLALVTSPATSKAGLAAKARLLATRLPRDFEDDDWQARLTWSLCNDLMGIAA